MRGKRILMIPGPIEFTDEVLGEMGKATLSHVDQRFIEEFGQALEKMRKVWLAPGAQPFIVAGSGTLAMELAAANLVEPGDKALVVHAGYFSDRMAEVLKVHGAEVDFAPSALGDIPTPENVRAALKSKKYKLMCVTHVDTSTGVRSQVKELAAAARSEGVLSVVDGVCAVAGEELRQDEWSVDVAFTASQKAVGVPPGLALLVAGPRALGAFNARKNPVRSYYCDWGKWLPVMEAYEARKPAYFGTPAVNIVRALNVSLSQILDEGMDARFKRHELGAKAFRAGIKAMGMGFVPAREELCASTLTAPYYPVGVDASVLGRIAAEGVVLAGGLHPEIKAKYFRVGHMGASGQAEILATLGAIEKGFAASGYHFEVGSAVAAAQAVFAKA